MDYGVEGRGGLCPIQTFRYTGSLYYVALSSLRASKSSIGSSTIRQMKERSIYGTLWEMF
jgi:hypothetical protein